MFDYFIGIDIGGSSIKAGVVDDQGAVLAHRTSPLKVDGGLEVGLRGMYDSVEAVVQESGVPWSRIRAIGVASPGTMDIPQGIVFHPFNLPGWEDLHLRDLVSEHFHRPAILQNDANAAAYGEYWAGAGRGSSSLMMWTLGTGIGGGIVFHGRILEGAHSHGGECGHLIMQMEGGRPSDFGMHGTLETYAGGKALVLRCKEAIESGRETMLSALIARGEAITPLKIAEAAEQGDSLADELIMDTAMYLGIGTTTIMHILNPEVFLLGGAMTFGRTETPLGRRFLQRLQDEVQKRAFPIPAQRTRIAYADLGNKAGFIGAAGCARLKYGRRVASTEEVPPPSHIRLNGIDYVMQEDADAENAHFRRGKHRETH